MVPRKWKDKFINFGTYSASIFTIFLLFYILTFIIGKGLPKLNWDMITNDYWSENYIVDISDTKGFRGSANYTPTENVFISEKYGIALSQKDKTIVVEYIEADSPLNSGINTTKGETYGDIIPLRVKSTIESMTIMTTDINTYGGIYGTTAQEMVELMDKGTVENIYFKTPGGGIYGSIQATLLLILISIIVSFPIGLFTAIFITEYEHKNRYFFLLERSIEVLAGIPSIIFGLMGMSVLYPIVSLFNVNGYSILLGGLTMSVVLLPIIIRAIQESLRVVPNEYRLASLSLGATQTQTIFKVVLPSALPGILSAVLLSISRVIGESAALIYTTGTFINNTPSLTTSGTSLAVHIWSIMSAEQPDVAMACAISIIILVIVLFLNLTLRLTNYIYTKRIGLNN